MKRENDYFKLAENKHSSNVKYLIVIFFLSLFLSCARKIYQKTDYTFYDKSFKLDTLSGLRTDGVYVLDQIWTNQNGGTFKKPKEHRFYKFYVSGQCNLTIDPTHEIKTKSDYVNAVSKDSVKKYTLFEGYYKLKSNKVIIQGLVVPRQQFEYKYGFVEKDSLIIVKSTTQGKGQFLDANFTLAYKEYYVFIPLNIKNEGEPQW